MELDKLIKELDEIKLEFRENPSPELEYRMLLLYRLILRELDFYVI